MTMSILNTFTNGASNTTNDRHILAKQLDVYLNNPYENVLYKSRAQDMAAETRTWHIRVSDTASGNGVGHGRMGYRCVYGRVMWPWFAKVIGR